MKNMNNKPELFILLNFPLFTTIIITYLPLYFLQYAGMG